jgi:hypothetical protein
MLRKSRKQLTIRFLHRTVLFLVSFSTGLVLFFIFGNLQEFLDSTQSLILSVLSASTLITLILSLVLIITEIILFFVKKWKLYISMLSVSFFCLIYSSILAILSHTILILSRGF